MSPFLLLLLLPGEVPTVESKEFARAVQVAAVTATVRVVNGTKTLEASGVIVGRNGPFVYILTAGHVAEDGDSLEIATFSAKSHPKPETVYRSGKVLARSLTPDLAVIQLATSDALPGTARLCPSSLAPEDGNFAGLTTGCSGGAAPSCVLEKMLGKRRVTKPGALVTPVPAGTSVAIDRVPDVRLTVWENPGNRRCD